MNDAHNTQTSQMFYANSTERQTGVSKAPRNKTNSNKAKKGDCWQANMDVYDVGFK